MSNTEQEEFTQEQQLLKTAATADIKKVLRDIEEVKYFATQAVLKLSLEVVPKQIDVNFTAIRVRLHSAITAANAALEFYKEYAANIELEEEKPIKTHKCRH